MFWVTPTHDHCLLSAWCLCQVAVASGLVFPASRDALEGRGLMFRLHASNSVPRWSLAMGLALLACVPAGLGGLSHGCLSNTCLLRFSFPLLPPLVIDCPASCVCLHCPGVQLDRATLWQVPQPGTSALDVQRTVHIRQVCVCLLRPRREESSSKPRCLLCWGLGEVAQESHSGIGCGWRNKPVSPLLPHLRSFSLPTAVVRSRHAFYVNDLPLKII